MSSTLLLSLYVLVRCGKKDGTYSPTLPSFFPFPVNPPPSSTPAQSPGLPVISPTNLSMPSTPIESTLTFSPTPKSSTTPLTEVDLLSCRLSGLGAAPTMDLRGVNPSWELEEDANVPRAVGVEE